MMNNNVPELTPDNIFTVKDVLHNTWRKFKHPVIDPPKQALDNDEFCSFIDTLTATEKSVLLVNALFDHSKHGGLIRWQTTIFYKLRNLLYYYLEQINTPATRELLSVLHEYVQEFKDDDPTKYFGDNTLYPDLTHTYADQQLADLSEDIFESLEQYINSLTIN